jgi:outer membrane protein
MKKITKTALALATCLVASNASADTILGVFAGVQSWNMGAEGSFGEQNGALDSSATFDFEKKNQTSFYLALEHPVPLVPNIKIKRNQMETKGDTLLATSFDFGGNVFNNNTTIATNVDLSNTDFILYYEILDNDLVTIDVGLNAKKIEGVLDVVDKTDASITATENFDGFVPMLYGNLEVGLPFTGLGVFAEGSLLSVGDHTLYDYEAGIGYTFIDNMAIDLTVQVGYRAIKLELQDLDNINSNLDFDGVFVGLEAHF